MANVISQVKLPDNSTYLIKDSQARPLDNNDFDTINVTELNAGDLIVTGVGRFTNGLYGNLIGNADTATSAIKATQDESGNNIKSTYANGISISDHTITLKNKNGTSLGTVTVPDNNTTYTIATGTANGKIKVTPSSGNAYEVSVYGLKSAAYKDVTDTYSETGTDPVSGKAVKSAIDGLPSPMVFRGTVGTGGTITNVPTDGTAVVGDTYKVITNGVYGGKSAKVGDTLICLTKTSTANTWELIPSGDEPSGTVTSVAVANGGGLSVSGSPITSSGTITISHADTSSQASVNNSGRTYIQDITLDTYGHVTGIASATETVVNTDRYVNSAAFADATSADANNPVKMTLTRAGSDTASVTAYIPKVSSSSAGVAPKGVAVSSQSQTTKFLREDGTWAAPSYTTSLAWGSVTGKPDSYTPSSHTHGNIQNGGTLQTTDITIASGDKLIVTDSSDSSKIARTSIAFDGSTATKALTQKGTWESFTNNSGTVTSVNATGATNTGISVTGGAITTSGTLTINLNLSDAINGLLTEGSSNAQRDDYIIAQYAGGGTTTKTYHRRKLSNIFAALNSSDITTALGYTPPTTDTKNTAGSTDTSSKIYLIGATSQAANPQTYSQDTAYVGTDGCVYSGGNKVEVVSNNAGYHNSVYRGKSLGTSITEAQWAAISAGTFEDMYIGDYWTLSTTLGSTTSNVQYVIAGFDYWWNCGDSYPQSSNKHHVVLVPASYLYSAQMNETNITTGGYIGSAMYTTNLANARTGISNLFGNHLYSVRRLFTNSVNTVGQATGWAWATSSVDLMSETMVYGHPVWTTSGFEVGVDRTILPLFALNPASASTRSNWWLRSVATPSYFALVNYNGIAYYGNASLSFGVRPAFAIY